MGINRLNVGPLFDFLGISEEAKSWCDAQKPTRVELVLPPEETRGTFMLTVNGEPKEFEFCKFGREEHLTPAANRNVVEYINYNGLLIKHLHDLNPFSDLSLSYNPITSYHDLGVTKTRK